jgi:hypothetical protein
MNMNAKKASFPSESNPVPRECSVEAVSARLFERALTFDEIAELSEKCGLWDIEQKARQRSISPFTFVVPANQFFGSVSRIVE